MALSVMKDQAVASAPGLGWQWEFWGNVAVTGPHVVLMLFLTMACMTILLQQINP